MIAVLVCRSFSLHPAVTVSIAREGTLAAIVLIALFALSAGHILGGPDEDDRTVLAFATVSRHPGVAVAIASLTDQPLAPVGILLAVLVSEITVVPYKLWRKRRRTASPAPIEHRRTGLH